MHKKLSVLFRFRWPGLLSLFLLLCAVLWGCTGGGNDVLTGVLVDAPVSGVGYNSGSIQGTTNSAGQFRYYPGETVTFSIGNLGLGAAKGAVQLTPLSLVTGATSPTDITVTKILILLQTLDQDGDLNNGIQITPAIATVVSDNAATIDLTDTTQTVEAFRTSLTGGILAALKAASPAVIKDAATRTVRTAQAAQDHFNATTAERKVVLTEFGYLSGYSVDENTWQWLGVPYAKPPVGDLRWKPPVAPDAWTGVRDATAWSNQAPQPAAYTAIGEGGVSEDCLYLNITAPKAGSNLPVMVWFHGGGFAILTGNTKGYNNPKSLPTKGVVLVSVVHRLNAFGYLAHPLLTAESGYNGSGNYGQLDLIAALTWIKNNISAFGGNPDNVTIFGQSGGGGKSISLMASPLATELFHKVICQSGMAPFTNPTLSGSTLAAAETKGTAFFNALGVTTLAEARALPWKTIMDAAFSTPTSWLGFGPNVDNYYMTDTMDKLVEAGLESDVPLLAGANSADLIEGINLAPGITAQMPERSDHNTAAQYVYKWSYVPPTWSALGVGAYHGLELVYLDNYPASFVSHYILGLSIVMTRLPPSKLTDADIGADPTSPLYTYQILGSTGYFTLPFTGAPTAESLAVTDQTMTIWTNFAKTGDPSITGFDWPAYTSANDTYVEIGAAAGALSVKTGLAAGFGTP